MRPLHNNGGPSRTNQSPKAPETAPHDPHAASLSKAAQGEIPYMSHSPGANARSQAGNETPPSMAYGRMDQASESTERLLPKQPERAARSGIQHGEDIPMQDMSAKARGKRKMPVDPSLQAVTKGGHAPLNAQGRLAEIPLTPHSSPRPSIDSTDPFGLPLPVTAGKGKKKAQAHHDGRSLHEQVVAEETALQKNNKKKGIAAGAALIAITVGGATASTLKSMGKI